MKTKRQYVYGIRIWRNFYDSDYDSAELTSTDLDMPRVHRGGHGWYEQVFTEREDAEKAFKSFMRRVELVDPNTKQWRKIDKKVDQVVECNIRDSFWSNRVKSVDVYTKLDPVGDDEDENEVITMEVAIVEIELL